MIRIQLASGKKFKISDRQFDVIDTCQLRNMFDEGCRCNDCIFHLSLCETIKKKFRVEKPCDVDFEILGGLDDET